MNKYLISADIEGITGVVNRSFSNDSGKCYQLGCRYMASDVNAVAQGILNADPEAEIVVRDAHGGSATNLNLELLHPKVRLIQGWDAQQNMLAGLDQSFKGVFLVGHHAGGQNIGAVLGHTMCSLINFVKINNKIVNETGLLALYAAHYNVPVAFISGDDCAVNEAREQLGEDIVGVTVKRSLGRGCADSLSLEQARVLLEKKAAEAVAKLQQNYFSPFKVSTPVVAEIKFYDTGVRASVLQNLAEVLAFDATYEFSCKEHTVNFSSDNGLMMLQRFSMLLFLIYGIRSLFD